MSALRKKSIPMYVIKKRSIGLDISDRTIEVVELTDEGDKMRVTSTGRVTLEGRVVERGRIKDTEQLERSISQAFEQATPHSISERKVVFGLPESQVYTHVFELWPHEKETRDELVLKEAQTSIPLKEDDILFSYSVLWEEEGKVEILLVAISKTVFLEWRNFFYGIKLEVLKYDSEMLATFRGLFAKRPKGAVCVVDIGARTSSIAIFNSRGMRYSHTLEVAGEAMDEEIARALKITQARAEEIKIKIGLSDKRERVFFVLIKILEQIAESVRSSLEYFKERTGEGVDRVFLVGESSKLKGIDKYFSDELGIPAWIGESALLRNVASLEFIEAIGLAIRGLDDSWEETDPIFYVKPAPTRDSREKKGDEQETDDKNGKEDIVLATPVELRQIRKLQFEKKVLLGILVLGVGLVSTAALYRDYRREKFFKELQRAQLERQAIHQGGF